MSRDETMKISYNDYNDQNDHGYQYFKMCCKCSKSTDTHTEINEITHFCLHELIYYTNNKCMN